MFEITVYDDKEAMSVDMAFGEFRRLWQWGMEEKYKNLTPADLAKQLGEFGYKLAENGGLHLINTAREDIPTDCYIDVKLKPTYVAAAVYIYAYNTHPEWFKYERARMCMENILEACLERGLCDHGYEAEIGKLDNMLLLAKAGAKDFLKKHPQGCESFCRFFGAECSKLALILKECRVKKQKFYVMGFGKIDADSQAKAIVELME